MEHRRNSVERKHVINPSRKCRKLFEVVRGWSSVGNKWFDTMERGADTRLISITTSCASILLSAWNAIPLEPVVNVQACIYEAITFVRCTLKPIITGTNVSHVRFDNLVLRWFKQQNGPLNVLRFLAIKIYGRNGISSRKRLGFFDSRCGCTKRCSVYIYNSDRSTRVLFSNELFS